MSDLNQQKQLAYTLYNQQKFAKASDKLDKLCKKDKSDPLLWFTAAMANGNTGRFHEAIDKFKQVLKLDPDNLDASVNLAMAAIEIKNFKLAVKYLQLAITHAPAEAMLHFNLGSALDEIGKYDAAIHHLLQALSFAPELFQVYNNLGLAYQHNGNYPEAIECFEKYSAYTPQDATAYNNLGIIYDTLSNYDAAETCFKKAIELEPGFVEAYRNYAYLSLNKGDTQTACSLYKKTIELKPDHYMAMYEYTLVADKNDTDSILKTMLSHVIKKTLPDESRINLCFGIGKLYNDRGEYKNAFDYFKLGHKLKHKTINYKIDNIRTEFQIIKQTYTQKYIAENISTGSDSEVPIFIIGMPRSGTSLVEQILSSHSDVYGTGEFPLFHDLLENRFGTSNWGELQPHLTAMSEQVQRELADSYLEKLMAKRMGNTRYITDKLPHNFLYTGLIKTLFPRARIIHCQRNPVDTCVSIYTTNFTALHSYAHNQQELGQYYNLYLDLMAHWRSVLPASALFEINYEALIANQEQETRKLLEYCQLEWQASCLQFDKTGALL